MKKFITGTFIVLCVLTCWAYKLPPSGNYDPKTTPFNITRNEDGTYNFYLKSFPQIKIYQSKKNDLLGFGEGGCGENPDMTGAYFLYVNDQKFPPEAVFLNTKTKELSSIYPMSDCTSPDLNSYMIMAEGAGKDEMEAVIIQPIFLSQPKVWLLIKRNLNDEFPGSYPGSKFLSNSNLFLVIHVEQVSLREWTATKTETIPIDYSIFEQKVSKPTCYAIPENHKLRLCNSEEAKIRSPALKVFLGEQNE